MGRLIRIKSGDYTFFLDGKSTYVQIKGDLNQKFVVQTADFKQLDQYSYVNLVDCIYRKKIKDSTTFYSYLYNKHRLVPTERRLV